jgi:hypothetical protein
MTTAVVVSRVRHSDRGSVLAIADIELDGLVLVRDVSLVSSYYSGRPAIVMPTRPSGSTVLTVPPGVAGEIVAAFLAALGPDAPDGESDA